MPLVNWRVLMVPTFIAKMLVLNIMPDVQQKNVDVIKYCIISQIKQKYVQILKLFLFFLMMEYTDVENYGE